MNDAVGAPIEIGGTVKFFIDSTFGDREYLVERIDDVSNKVFVKGSNSSLPLYPVDPKDIVMWKSPIDVVNHPSHYTYGNVETIDVIREWLGPEKFVAYLNGNIIKYISRWEHKNGVEDLKKAKWYLEKMIEELG